MSDCLFCKIMNGDISADKVFEDDRIFAFKDINPQAPVHVLIIPRKHIPTVNELTEADDDMVGHIYRTAARLAQEFGISSDGYRIVTNCNAMAGQSVYHIHFHLLGGRPMNWPPG